MTTFEPLPATMRAAVMYDVDDIRIEVRPLPALEPGDILVRTAASGVCSGDLMPWYVRRKAPFVFGHEPAGTVVAVAGDASAAVSEGARVGLGGLGGLDGRIGLGDRVFAHHHAPCLRCAACRAGRFVHCATWRATALDPGGMAEYFRVPRANLADTLALPAHLSFADGSLVEPLACVVKSLRRALPVPAGTSLAGTTLYVIGAGVMGLMHVAVAAARGARVFASDFHAARREHALSLGAAAAFPPQTAADDVRAATNGSLADAVICGPGSPAALAHAVETVRADGTVLMFTPLEPDQRFSFDQSAAYFRDLRLVASYSCGPDDTAEALGLLGAGIVTAAGLGAREVGFPAVADAYEMMKSAEVVKAIVTFEGNPAS